MSKFLDERGLTLLLDKLNNTITNKCPLTFKTYEEMCKYAKNNFMTQKGQILVLVDDSGNVRNYSIDGTGNVQLISSTLSSVADCKGFSLRGVCFEYNGTTYSSFPDADGHTVIEENTFDSSGKTVLSGTTIINSSGKTVAIDDVDLSGREGIYFITIPESVDVNSYITDLQVLVGQQFGIYFRSNRYSSETSQTIVAISHNSELGCIEFSVDNMFLPVKWNRKTGTETQLPIERGYIYFTDFNTYGDKIISSGTSVSGVYNTAVLIGAHAEGESTVAEGKYSHSEGTETYSSYAAHSEGKRTKAVGFHSHTEGYGTTATGSGAHAEGYSEYNWFTQKDKDLSRSTLAAGKASHAEGFNTKAYGTVAHSEGYHTIANNNYSHAAGLHTTTDADCQTTIGCYNKVDSAAQFIVGGGSSKSNLVNLFTVKKDGRAVLGSTPQDTMDAVNLGTLNDVTLTLNNTIKTHTHKKYDDLIKYNILRNDIVTDKSNKVSFEEVNEYKIYTAEKPTQQSTYTIHQDTTHSLTYTAQFNCEHNIFTVPNYNALVWRKNSESVSGAYRQDWLDFKITNNGNINYLPQYLCQIKFKIVSTPSTLFLRMYKKGDTKAVFDITMTSQNNYLHIDGTNLGIRADEWFILTFKITPNHLSLCCNDVSCYEGNGRCDFTLNEIDSFRITSSTQNNHETHINLISGDYCGGPRLSKYIIKADDKFGDTVGSEQYLNDFRFKIYDGLSVEDFDEVSGL